MLDFDNVSLNALANLIRLRVPESLNLEYKRSDALSRSKTDEICKDVSAFANSAGGTIIYGIVEDKELRVPVSLDDGCDPAEISREWIEDIITSNVFPKIIGLSIHEVALESGRSVFIVFVPQATTFAPHQSRDKKYYRRYNFKSQPMDDYEIRDLLKRSDSPSPVLYFSSPTISKIGDDFKVSLDTKVTNRSVVPADFSIWKTLIDQRLKADVIPIGGADLHSLRHEPIRILDSEFLCSVKQTNLHTPNHLPLIKETNYNFFKITFKLKNNGSYFVGYQAISRGFTEIRGAVFNLNCENLWISYRSHSDLFYS